MLIHRLVIVGTLVLAALIGQYGFTGSGSKSEDKVGLPEARLLSVNRVRLGMKRAEVDGLFFREKRDQREISEHFGMLPGAAGYGDGTWVRFESTANEARVMGVSGVNLSFDGVDLCRELWLFKPGPDPRPAAMRGKFGIPDEVTHIEGGACWHYRRYQLKIDTSPEFPWYFRLGVVD